MREISKEVRHTIDDQEMTFIITKMDALKGAWLMKFCAEKLLPLFNQMRSVFAEDSGEGLSEDELAQKRTNQVIEILPGILSSLTEEDLMTLQKRCLATVKAVLPGGLQPVLTGNSFGVAELEYDIVTVLVLCYEVIEFNLGSFFGGNPLASLRLPQNT